MSLCHVVAALTVVASQLAGQLEPLEDNAFFGSSVAGMGDLDGDGLLQVAVGSPGHGPGGSAAGAVWLLELNADGSLGSDLTKISAVDGGFGAGLMAGDDFGRALASADLDGDGQRELFVGAPKNGGAVWVLFLDVDGNVQSKVRIAANAGGFTSFPAPGDEFGSSVSVIGDLDADGVPDLAVGAPFDDDGGIDRGAVWVLFMNPNGSVKSHAKISELFGGFGGELALGDRFGSALTGLGDLNGDGVCDLVASALLDDDGAAAAGALWVLFLGADGSVAGEVKISALAGGLPPVLSSNARFGTALAAAGDVDGDGNVDVAVGWDDFPEAFFLLYLESDGSVKDLVQYSSGVNGLPALPTSQFGTALGFVGDVDGDLRSELIVGALADNELGPNRGAAWTLFFDSQQLVSGAQKLLPLADFVPGSLLAASKLSLESPGGLGGPGSLGGPLALDDEFASAAATLGDLDGDGVIEVAVGAPGDDATGPDCGAVWILSLDADATVIDERKISARSGGFDGFVGTWARFGASVGALGDFDGDGIPDLVVGAPEDGLYEAGGGALRGAVWLLFLHADGSVREHRKIAPGLSGFSGPLSLGDRFGAAVCALGDVDLDGTIDLAVGAPGTGADRGGVWILTLAADGTVKSAGLLNLFFSISSQDEAGASLASVGDFDGNGIPDLLLGSPGRTTSQFDVNGGQARLVLLGPGGGMLSTNYLFGGSGSGDRHGSSVTTIGDLDGDGVLDFAAGMPGEDSSKGGLNVYLMDAGGTVKAHEVTLADPAALPLEEADFFGAALASLGDLDGDGVEELLVGASGDDDGRQNAGALWIVSLVGAPALGSAVGAGDAGRVTHMPVTRRSHSPATPTPAERALYPHPLPGAAGVWVVDDDGGPGVDAVDVQSAIDLAADGDVVLVRRGTYTGFAIDGKSLVVLGEDEALINETLTDPDGLIVVRNLDANQFVLLQGLHGRLVEGPSAFSTSESGAGTVLAVVDCAGPVWVQYSDLNGGGEVEVVRVQDSDAVVLTRCLVEAEGVTQSPFGGAETPAPALRVTATQLFVYDSLVRGGPGSGGGGCNTFTCSTGEASGDAVVIVSGLLHASSSLFAGGPGEHGFQHCENFGVGGDGGAGGAGLRLLGASAVVESYGSDFLGGSSSVGDSYCSPGPAGVDVDAGPGSFTTVASVPRRVAHPTPIVEGDDFRLQFVGEPGDVLLGGLSGGAGFPLTVAPALGALQLGFPLNLISLGVIPSGGSISLTTSAAQVSSGIGVVFLQLLHITPFGEAYLGPPTALGILDDAL